MRRRSAGAGGRLRSAGLAIALASHAGASRADEPASAPAPATTAPADKTPRGVPPANPSAPPVQPTPTSPPFFDMTSDDTPDFFTPRYEPAGFPLIGGDSDIGLQFGGVVTLTRFANGIRPYAWNMDVVLSASVKQGPSGAEIAQQNYLWQWDVPGLDEGRLRLNPMAQYRRTVNAGYYGLGNASSGARPVGSNGRYFQYVHQEAGSRLVVRYALNGPYDLMFSTTARFVNPGVYDGSKLAEDAAALAGDGGPRLLGVQSMGVVGQAAGVVYDSRDTEIFPKQGAFHRLGVKLSQGIPFDAKVRYGQAGLILANYTPVGGPFLFATRLVADFEFGNIPFYDLYTGGVFVPDELPGGSAGIRGVPVARYIGPIKVVANVEMRALWGGFHVLGQSFHLGNAIFFDTGRVWSDYTFSNPLDGRRIGLKWGAGAGTYLLWGQAAIFRLEIAYSPDAEAENPGFPLGIYVEDGVMF